MTLTPSGDVLNAVLKIAKDIDIRGVRLKEINGQIVCKSCGKPQSDLYSFCDGECQMNYFYMHEFTVLKGEFHAVVEWVDEAYS